MTNTGVYNRKGLLVAVDCIIFGYAEQELKLLLFERWIEPDKDKLSLLGGWVNDDESVTEAAQRVLKLITGLGNLFMEMVDVFSEVDRDPGGRVISIAYYALMNIREPDKKIVEEHGAKWVSLNELPKLIFDHNEMVDKALAKLQNKASFDLIGEHMLPSMFTLSQLRKLYNAVFQVEFDPGNFRKKILSLKLLEQMNVKDYSESKKGAYFYRFKPVTERKENKRIVNH